MIKVQKVKHTTHSPAPASVVILNIVIVQQQTNHTTDGLDERFGSRGIQFCALVTQLHQNVTEHLLVPLIPLPKTQKIVYLLKHFSLHPFEVAASLLFTFHHIKDKRNCHLSQVFLLDESDLEEWSNQIRDEVRPLAIQTIPHLQHNLNH